MRWLRTPLVVPVLRALLLVPVLLALVVGGAAARGAARGGLDPSFGSDGTVSVEGAKDVEWAEAKVAADGRLYVLTGSLLLAFESNGAPVTGFGLGGRVTVASALGEGSPSDFAIDSQGRLLVSGSAVVPNSTATQFSGKPTEAYLIRFLPDGARDPSFGTGGEVDTDFGLPAETGKAMSVSAGPLIVDAQDRPIVGGEFGPETSCGYGAEGAVHPYIARLSAAGAPDPSFAGKGYATLGGAGGVSGLAATRGGNLAVFSNACPTGARYESRAPEYSVFTEGGAPSPIARHVPLGYSYVPMLVDRRGRVVQLESSPPAGEGVDAVTRYLPNGNSDRGFGRHGSFLFRHKPHYADAIAVDAKNRPIVAMSAKRIVLRRFLTDGEVDERFGPKGQLTAKGAAPRAIAVDAEGRIYTVAVSKGPTATSVQISRFIPGR
jgi:uncharacterized delta-60 repeat protein